MVNTRSRGLAVPERSLLQLERDQIVRFPSKLPASLTSSQASYMNFDWIYINERSSNESRGIQNGGNLCYQNCVLQMLMHQPGFLQWINTHNTVGNPCQLLHCLKCSVLKLMKDYWGVTEPRYAVHWANAPEEIAQLAVTSGLFEEGEQDDAMSFFSWLTDTLYENPS